MIILSERNAIRFLPVGTSYPFAMEKDDAIRNIISHVSAAESTISKEYWNGERTEDSKVVRDGGNYKYDTVVSDGSGMNEIWYCQIYLQACDDRKYRPIGIRFTVKYVDNNGNELLKSRKFPKYYFGKGKYGSLPYESDLSDLQQFLVKFVGKSFDKD